MSEQARWVVELAGHDPSWRRMFEDDRDRILEIGADDVVAVEHIGSTAIPGLAAKPVIDMLVGLRRWPASDAFLDAMAVRGFNHHGEFGIVGRHYFTDGVRGGPRTKHVHAVAHGSRFWRNDLLFRDWLRTHPADLEAYERLKRRLAIEHREDVSAYTDAKTTFIRDVLRRAREEEGIGAVHDAADRGYDAAADVYERARPTYPPEAVEHIAAALGLRPRSRVVDVGAGTGKLTEALVRAGLDVTAVEPVAGMHGILAQRFPAIEVAGATAEELPFPMRSVAAIVAGQAFHWFDPFAALSEFHRVLVEGGGIGLLWNDRDESVDWVARWNEIVEPLRTADASRPPRSSTSPWRNVVVASELFTDPETVTFENAHTVDRETLVERVASTSVVAALEAQRRAQVLEEIRHLLDTHPETRDRMEIEIPYRTRVHTFRRVP